mmetsp:Transcript_16450/g.37945  ORF Transcript_16450/g.37945 Transcript_16450/m.37945 type:complete len:272 (+) Transcript_16450:755-1570(+)
MASEAGGGVHNTPGKGGAAAPSKLAMDSRPPGRPRPCMGMLKGGGPAGGGGAAGVCPFDSPNVCKIARATWGSRSISACFSRSAVKNCIAICLLLGAAPPAAGFDDTGTMLCVARAIDTITGGGIAPVNIPPDDGTPGNMGGGGICPNNGGCKDALADGGGGAGAKPLACGHCPSRGPSGPVEGTEGMVWASGGRILSGGATTGNLGRFGSSSPLGPRGLDTKLPPRSSCGTAGERAPQPPPPFPFPGGPIVPNGLGDPGLHPLRGPMYIP